MTKKNLLNEKGDVAHCPVSEGTLMGEGEDCNITSYRDPDHRVVRASCIKCGECVVALDKCEDAGRLEKLKTKPAKQEKEIEETQGGGRPLAEPPAEPPIEPPVEPPVEEEPPVKPSTELPSGALEPEPESPT